MAYSTGKQPFLSVFCEAKLQASSGDGICLLRSIATKPFYDFYKIRYTTYFQYLSNKRQVREHRLNDSLHLS